MTSAFPLFQNPNDLDLSSLHPQEQVEVEIDSLAHGLVVGGENAQIVNSGTQTYTFLGCDLKALHNLVETNPEGWTRALQRYTELVDEAKKQYGSSPTTLRIKLKILSYEESPSKIFRSTMFRDVKPLTRVTVLRLKGILPTVQNRAEESQATLAQALKVIVALTEEKSQAKASRK